MPRRAASPPSAARRWALSCLLVVAPLGVGTKFYAGPWADWVRDSGGGVLYVVFWILVILAIWPAARPARVAGFVVAATSLLELLQLWHPPALEMLRRSFAGHALLGNTFSWLDLPHYLLGGVLGVALARAVRPPPR